MVEEDRQVVLVVLADLVIREIWPTCKQTQLIQREVLAYPHRERDRYNLKVERTVIPVSDLVEAMSLVGDDAGEDVDSSSRALGIGLGLHPAREAQTLL